MAERKVSYLGDGVYAEIENGMVKLTTCDGREVSNTIYLEPDILEALLTFIADSGLLSEGT
jgi:hypothetical protein